MCIFYRERLSYEFDLKDNECFGLFLQEKRNRITAVTRRLIPGSRGVRYSRWTGRLDSERSLSVPFPFIAKKWEQEGGCGTESPIRSAGKNGRRSSR